MECDKEGHDECCGSCAWWFVLDDGSRRWGGCCTRGMERETGVECAPDEALEWAHDHWHGGRDPACVGWEEVE